MSDDVKNGHEHAPGWQEAEDAGVTVTHPRVVVGVDASPEAKAALAWAAQYARLGGARLDVVHAWRLDDESAWLQELPPPAPRTAVAQDELEKLVEEVVGFGVDAEARVVEGRAAKVLVHEARGALLLVVGSRGHGGFEGLLLGSVSAQCAAHAPCSVVIVRPDRLPEAS